VNERRRRDAATVADLTEAVHELTQPATHTQPLQIGWRYKNRTGPILKDHRTNHPSLLDQLRDTVTDRPAATGERGALPHFDADALDRLTAITVGVQRWLTRLSIPSEAGRLADRLNAHLIAIEQIIDKADGPIKRGHAGVVIDYLRKIAATIRGAVEPDLRALLQYAPQLPEAHLNLLVADAENWATWCRICAGWQEPLARPNVACMRCGAMPGERAGLRVRLWQASGTGGVIQDAALDAAVCLTCNATWDAGTIGILAGHIRASERSAERDDLRESE
jgi:hypothetical protein